MKNIYNVLLLLFIIGSSSQAQDLAVMTYNIRLDVASDADNDWNHRKAFLTDQLAYYAPDIFGIQEALPHQVVDVQLALPAYKHIGIGREGENQGEASSIFYQSKQYAVQNETTFWLSPTPDDVSKGWDAACLRVCTFGLFTQLKTGKQFWVFNTHLDHMGEEARTNGLQLILAKIKAVNTQNYPVILMGDFNSTPNHLRIQNLKNSLNDSRDYSETKPFGPSGTFNGFAHNKPVTDLIDYVFVSKSGIEVKKYAVLSDAINMHYPSDHLPVFVHLELK
ncbi:MAG: endonuclease/exonuclease/phosphatase family protein [Flavobacterium sp.]|nr:endonuclease/exonuclease/phosphatase family protein [Flavobacterium sp.]